MERIPPNLLKSKERSAYSLTRQCRRQQIHQVFDTKSFRHLCTDNMEASLRHRLLVSVRRKKRQSILDLGKLVGKRFNG